MPRREGRRRPHPGEQDNVVAVLVQVAELRLGLSENSFERSLELPSGRAGVLGPMDVAVVLGEFDAVGAIRPDEVWAVVMNERGRVQRGHLAEPSEDFALPLLLGLLACHRGNVTEERRSVNRRGFGRRM